MGILKVKYISVIFFLLMIVFVNLNAAIIQEDVNDNNRSKFWMALPYAVSTESTGLVGGVVGLWSGYGQKQMNIIATGYYGMSEEVEGVRNKDKEANAFGVAIGVNNYKPSFSNRMFISLLGSHAYYPNQALYIDGRNSSSADDVLRSQGYNNWYNMSFKYSLPLGEYKDKATLKYALDRGLPIGREKYGGGMPFVTGTTQVAVTPFYNKWTADKLTDEPAWTAVGIKIKLEHDNTDYVSSPSRGYSFEVQYAQDFGDGGSIQSWKAVEASYTQFIEIPHLSWMRNNVIALNVWSAYSPSWQTDKFYEGTSTINANRPPPWEGARLGGNERMRGYSANRFSDKSAIYYGAEYRFIPDFNPLNKKDNGWMPVGIDWFQGVLFVEAGRVAPKYTLGELHTDMKYDVGLSIRALAAKLPVRFEFAVGDEGPNMALMIKQTF